MAIIRKSKFVKAGDWRTIEWFFNSSAKVVFRDPAGARIKVRYGLGWFGFDRQKQTLDGFKDKTVEVGGAGSVARARVQMRVSTSTDVAYAVVLPGGPQPEGVSGQEQGRSDGRA